MQGIGEIEAICYQTELDRAEAFADAQDKGPGARECFDSCVHASACYRIYYTENDEPEDEEEAIAEFLGTSGCAGECPEYEDAWCVRTISGPLARRWPNKAEEGDS